MLEQLQKQLNEKGVITFKVKIVPGSSRNKIMGELGEENPNQSKLFESPEPAPELASRILKIKIAAPPEKGKANAALIDFLSKTFNVPAKNIEIVSGHTSPLKIIQIKENFNSN